MQPAMTLSLSKRTTILLAALGLAGNVHAATPRIVGGTAAPNHAYPFMAAIEYQSDGFQFCGGTLVAPNKVLTAGHCVETAEPIQVRLGTNNKSVDSGQVVKVVKQVPHPKFDGNTLDYDVAVFTLESDVKLTDKVNLVKLPERCKSLTCYTGLARPGLVLRVAGWGSTRKDGLNSSLALRQTDVPVVDNTTCDGAVGGVTPRMICAGFAEGGHDACSGDSGGPLFGYLDGARTGVQAGIVSWGVGACADPGYYGVYTRISDPDVRAFIRNLTGR